MAQPKNQSTRKEYLTTILSKVGIDVTNKSLNYEQFEALCVQTFNAAEVEQHQQRVREIFHLFDANADGTLLEEELLRCYEWINATVNPTNVLIIIDMQNDFINGTLALRKCEDGQEAEEIIEPINQLLKLGHWHKVIYSLDWHPQEHISFFENLAMRQLHPESKVTKASAKMFDTVVFLEPYITQTLWPKHCVMNTWGAELHENLLVLPSSERVYKGQDPEKERYSPFQEKDTDGTSRLEKILLATGATHLYVCGIAYDVCVKETCLDALRLGYRLAVVDECTRGIKSNDIKIARNVIRDNGGLVMCNHEVLSMVNENKRSLLMAHNAVKRLFKHGISCSVP